MLELSHKEFKITMNMLSVLMNNVDSIQEQICKVSIEVETNQRITGNQKP